MNTRIAFCIITLFLSGCISVGSHRMSVPTEAVVSSDDPRVILIIIDGLNHDTLKRYLKVLSDADHEPNWQSGLSLLARQDFKIANAQYPMTALPPFSPTAEATMMTGQPPIVHGLVSSRFSRLPSAAPHQEIDLRSADLQHAFLLDKNHQQPTDSEPAMGTLLLNIKPWLVSLHQSRSSSSIFLPFGEGGTWYIPALTRPLSKALFDNTVSKQTTLLLDQKIEDIAEDVIAKGEHLTIVRFTGVRGHSCAPTHPGCRDASKGLNLRQQEALTRIDQRLWNLFRNFEMRHPEAFEKTVFVISGTVGTSLRPSETLGNPAFSVNLGAVNAALNDISDSVCKAPTTSAQATPYHRLWADSGFASIQVPSSIQGQQTLHHERTRCVVKNLQRLAKQLEAEGKLDAVVWHEPGAKIAHVHFTSTFSTHSGSLERRRISDKLKALTEHTKHGQIVGALFLSPPFIFSGSTQQRVHRGNLRRQTIRFPFLIADKRLSQTARRQIEGATIDHIDFGPTIFGLLNQKVPSTLKFPRKPLLEFSESDASRARVLNYSRKQRNIYQNPKTPQALEFVEAANGVTLIYREGRSIWPPDTLSLSLGSGTATWSIETQSFDQEFCIFTHEQEGRTWQCTLPFPPDVSTPAAKLTRTPSVNGDKETVHRTQFYRRADAPVITRAQRVCGAAADEAFALEFTTKGGLFGLSLHAPAPGQKSSSLTPFNMVEFSSAALVAQICPQAVDSSKVCSFDKAGRLIALKGRFPLNALHERMDAPKTVFVCARSGQCVQKDIELNLDDCP